MSSLAAAKRRLGLPRRFWGARPSDLPVPAPDPRAGAFAWGDTGCGKTHLLAAVAHAELEALEARAGFQGWEAELALWDALAADGKWSRLPLLFTSAPSLMTEIKSTFRRDAPLTERDVVRRHGTVPLLLLDDLGAQLDTDWSLSVLDQIVDLRWGEGLPTCVSSNLSPQDLRDRRGMERIASRLLGSCGAVVEMKGRDRRCL